MGDWITAIATAIGSIFKWLTGRQEMANDPVIKKNKIAQQLQDEADRIERLVHTATSDPDPAKRFAAAEELRRMDSE